MSSGGKPTEVRTITMVTRPAWGIPAAPILAAVAVILRIDGQSQVTCSFHWYMQFCHCTLVVKVTRFKYHFMFSLLYIVKCNLFLWWQSWIFSSHYSSLQCHMILQNHSDMLIWCSIITMLLINIDFFCRIKLIIWLKTDKIMNQFNVC